MTGGLKSPRGSRGDVQPEHCPPRPAGRSTLLAVALCAHCSLTVVTGIAAAGVLALPPVFGIAWAWVLPPVMILTAFTGWLWWGARGDGARTAT